MNNFKEHVQLVKLHTLLSNTDTTTKEIYTFLKENIDVFTCVDFRKQILKESLMLLMILDESDDSSTRELILDVVFQLLNFRE